MTRNLISNEAFTIMAASHTKKEKKKKSPEVSKGPGRAALHSMHLPEGELRHWTALVTCDQAIWVSKGTGRGFRDVISFVCVHAYCSLTQHQPAAAAVVLGGEVKQSPMDKSSTTYLISYLSQYRSCTPSASPHQWWRHWSDEDITSVMSDFNPPPSLDPALPKL